LAAFSDGKPDSTFLKMLYGKGGTGQFAPPLSRRPMAVASPKQAAQTTAMRRPAADEAPVKMVPEFSKDQELTASAICCASGDSRRKPVNYTEWG